MQTLFRDNHIESQQKRHYKHPQPKNVQHLTNIATLLEISHHQRQMNTISPTNKTKTTLKDNLFMKMRNHVEDNLEFVKNKRDRIARIIKYLLVSLFPNQVDQNTKENSTHSTNKIVTPERKP